MNKTLSLGGKQMENKELIIKVTQQKNNMEYYYEKLIQERFEGEKKIRTEVYNGDTWKFIRETVNNNFRKASLMINNQEIKLKVPSKKRVSMELSRLLDMDINLK